MRLVKIRLNDKEEIAMITWNNLDTLESFKELSKVGRVDIKEAMSGDNGAKRVKEYNIPMAIFTVSQTFCRVSFCF